MKKILVTGSSGTIGTRLCEKLLEQGFVVKGIDVKENKWNKHINEITTIADLRKKDFFEKIDSDFDIVINLAANARVYNLVVEPELALDNIKMVFNVLEFCRKNNIKKNVFASSREVYGNTQRDVSCEQDARIDDCESPYTASKIAGEALVQAYKRCYGIDFVITRFSNVYGMYDDSDRVIPLFIKLTHQNKDLVVFGGEKLLDFTYIDDVITGVIKIIKGFDEKKNEVYNLATGEGVAILDVAKIIQKEMNNETKITIEDNRKGEVVRFIADNSKAKEKLKFEPKIKIKEGIQKSIKWYKENIEN